MAEASSDFDAQQLRLVMRRLTDENFFAELGFHFSYYMQRVAKIRNNGDSINITLKKFLDRDDSSVGELKRSLEFFRKSSASLQDYRDAEVMRLEERVVKPLCSYAAQFKRVRSQLTSANTAKQKQLKEAAKLGSQLRRSNSQASAAGGLGASQQSTASVNSAKSLPTEESNASGLSGAAAASDGLLKDKKLVDELRSFEQHKLEDLKTALLEFLKIEILSTSKQLELLTGMFHSLNEYDSKVDLASYCKVILKQETLELTDPKKERAAARKRNKKQSQSQAQPGSSQRPKKTEDPVYSVVQKAPSGSRNSLNKKDENQYEEVGNAEENDDEDSTWDDEYDEEEEEEEEDEEEQQRPTTSKVASKNVASPKPVLPSTRAYENTPVANKQRTTGNPQQAQKSTDQLEESDEDFDSEDELSLTPRNGQTNRTMLSSKSVSFAK